MPQNLPNRVLRCLVPKLSVEHSQAPVVRSDALKAVLLEVRGRVNERPRLHIGLPGKKTVEKVEPHEAVQTFKRVPEEF